MDDRLRIALSTVTEQQSGRNLIDAGRIESASVADSTATILLAPPIAGKSDLEALQPLIEKAVASIDGIDRTRIIMTAHSETPQKPARPKHTHSPKRPAAKRMKKPAKQVLVVASGKGGVGKSTIAANIAAALARDGKSVGLLDADIYGPSAPRLFGLNDVPGLRKTDDGLRIAKKKITFIDDRLEGAVDVYHL